MDTGILLEYASSEEQKRSIETKLKEYSRLRSTLRELVENHASIQRFLQESNFKRKFPEPGAYCDVSVAIHKI